MESQALRAIKWKIALVANGGGLLELIVVRAWSGLVSIAGPASSAFAGMVGCIVCVVTTVALVAPIALIDEACNGSTPLVMIV